jgi:hypothetical protein
MEGPIKTKLLAVISDTSAPKDQRKLAAEILAWWERFDVPSMPDKDVVAMLREWHADTFWRGISTIVEHDARNVRPA